MPLLLSFQGHRPLQPRTSTPSIPSEPTSTDTSLDPPEASPHPQISSAPFESKALVSADQAAETSSIQSTAALEGFHVTAYTVSKPLRYAEIHKALAKALRACVRDELSKLPENVVDRVLKLVTAGLCPTLTAGTSKDLLRSQGSIIDSDGSVIFDFADPTSTGERLQDFIEGVYDELITYYRTEASLVLGDRSGLRERASGTAPWGLRAQSLEMLSEDEKTEGIEETKGHQEDRAESHASEGTERVEALICTLLYNRSDYSVLDVCIQLTDQF